MSEAGLRVGALPTLEISGERYTCTTNGKAHSGRLPARGREALKKAGLSLRAPFARLTVEQIEDSFRYLARKLHKAGKLAARYSAHDLRHSYAIRFYKTTHDIYQVKQTLGHASVQVSEYYLKSLGQTL